MTYIGRSINFYITTCTPIDDQLNSKIKSDLLLDSEHNITPDRLIYKTQSYFINKDKIKILSKYYHDYLSLINATEYEQLKKQLDNITDDQVKKFSECNEEIDNIVKQILEEILDKYLPQG